MEAETSEHIPYPFPGDPGINGYSDEEPTEDERRLDENAEIHWGFMGQTWQKGLQIDRREGGRGYNKENCRWVTREENRKNQHVWTPYDFRFLMEKRGALVAYLTYKERFDWEMSHKCRCYIICRWKNGPQGKYYLPELESWEGIFAFLNEFYIGMTIDHIKDAPRHLHAIVDLMREEERRKRLKRVR